MDSTQDSKVESHSKKIVLLFNQITDTVIDDLAKHGFVDNDGVPTGVVEFRMSTPPFNVRLAEKSARVATFLSAVKVLKGAYNMPAYGDALFALVDHPLAKASAIPYTLGIDDFVVSKAGPKWQIVVKWLQSVDLLESKSIIEAGSAFMDKALAYVKNHSKTLTLEQHRTELLEPCLGADWRKRSENLNSSKFLRLFGASDELLDLFVKAEVSDGKGGQTSLLNEARWIANFINLFKPTTEFKKGAVSDMLNFAAMFSGIKFGDRKLTDQDSLLALQFFNSVAQEMKRVERAYFDMEPDDVGVMTYVHVNTPATIVRVYPTKDIADAAEKFMESRIVFGLDDEILIDPLLENGKVLSEIYCSTA